MTMILFFSIRKDRTLCLYHLTKCLCQQCEDWLIQLNILQKKVFIFIVSYFLGFHETKPIFLLHFILCTSNLCGIFFGWTITPFTIAKHFYIPLPFFASYQHSCCTHIGFLECSQVQLIVSPILANFIDMKERQKPMYVK